MISQSLTSALSPPIGDELGPYLEAVSKEMGLRGDSDLARLMEVPASSVANWKRRRQVPAGISEWFPREILANAARKDRVMIKSGTIALQALVELLNRKDGDLLDYGEPLALHMTGQAVPALYSIAQVLMRGPLGPYIQGADDHVATNLLADALAEAMPALRRLIRPPPPDEMGSQQGSQ